PEPPPGGAPSVRPRPDRLRGSRRHRWPARAALTGLFVGLAAFALVNTGISVQTFRESAAYYTPMTPGGQAALEWLGGHAPPGASIFSSSPYYAKWIWAKDDRQAFSPANLDLSVTSSSFAQTEAANFVALGDDNIGDSQIDVASSLEGSGSAPTIYLAVPGDWNELFGGNSTQTNLTVARGPSEQVLRLSAAETIEGPILNASSTGAELQQSFDWPGALGGPVELTETLRVDGASVSDVWSSSSAGVGLLSLSEAMMVPSSTTATTGFVRGAPGSGCVEGGVPQPLEYLGAGFSVTLSDPGGLVCSSSGGVGTVLTIVGPPSFSMVLAGFPAFFPTSPYAIDALAFLPSHEVRYVLTDVSDGYPDFGPTLYERFSALSPATGLTTVPCFASGSLHILGLGGC
ncbi:MAG: hypothetical protein ACREC5_00460, partial [Thermoplasmata archaeon]